MLMENSHELTWYTYIEAWNCVLYLIYKIPGYDLLRLYMVANIISGTLSN